MVIGIDTSGLVCSVAAIDGDSLICEFSTNNKRTHSQQLLPMLDICMTKAGLSISDADCIAVSEGPGSFTGIRIGAATAKGLAMSLDKPVVGVSSLLALAYNIPNYPGLVVPIMDAKRGEVYTAAYDFSAKETFVSDIISPEALSITALSDKINDLGKEVIFLGDAVPVYGNELKEMLKVPFEFAPAHLLLQRASCVALIGRRYYESGTYPKTLSVSYLRRPQAERERLGL